MPHRNSSPSADGVTGASHPLLALLTRVAALRQQCNSEEQLLADLCQALVETGEHACACIALTPGDTPAAMPSLAAVAARDTRPDDWATFEASPDERFVAAIAHGSQRFGLLGVSSTTPLNGDECQALRLIADSLAETLARLRAEQARQQMESRLRQLSRALESSSNGVMITSSTQLDHPIVYVNPAFERITGYRADEVIGISGRFLVRDDLNQKGLNTIRDALRNRHEGHAILRNYRKDGSLFWNELYISPVRDEAGEMTTHFVSIINDVTERIHYEQQLAFHANHDTLTGLANRNLLNDRIGQAIAQARDDGLLAGVLLLDLDRFKLIDDGFGHTPANELLKGVASRLAACVRDSDTVARLGGDEFVIVVGRLQAADDLAVVASKTLRAFSQPFLLEGKEIFVTASIGAAIYPRDGDHGEALLRNADVAMYRVKEHGRNNYRFYTPEMTHMALDRLDMEGNLRRALERDELVVHYQPIVSLNSGRITGAEALIRWEHPRIGRIPPGEFIPLAEETGLIIPLGQFIIRQVCHDLRAWDAAGLPPLRVSINLSARQFRQDDLIDTIASALREFGIAGERLGFELTESMMMHDLENTLTTLRDLQALGALLSLDDFGTGYSSLSYLKRFPIDVLKIDRSFIRDIHENADDAAIAHAVIAMGHRLGMRIVAEGVENEAQLALLRDFGCDALQGFHFSRPVPAEEFTLMLRQGKRLDGGEA